MTAIDDNNVATLEHNDRVCEIKRWFISSPLWGKVLPAMQALTLIDLVFSLTVQSGVCTTSATVCPERHSISGINKYSFGLQQTPSILPFQTFTIPATSQPRQWSLASQ
jgi:hypothetical protein